MNNVCQVLQLCIPLFMQPPPESASIYYINRQRRSLPALQLIYSKSEHIYISWRSDKIFCVWLTIVKLEWGLLQSTERPLPPYFLIAAAAKCRAIVYHRINDLVIVLCVVVLCGWCGVYIIDKVGHINKGYLSANLASGLLSNLILSSSW